MSAVEKFPILLSDAEEESSAVPPCFSHEGINVRSPDTRPSALRTIPRPGFYLPPILSFVCARDLLTRTELVL